jgi:hypothetical protein
MLLQMHRQGMARRLPLAGAAVAGAVVGHTLAWTLTVPEPAERLALLATSGHTYWSAAVAAAIVLGLVSLAATLTVHFRAGLRAGRHPAGKPFGHLAGRLALLQVGIYLVQEVLERTAAGAPLGDAIDGRLLLFGVTVQVAVAIVLAAVLAWVGRVAEVAGEALRRRHLPRLQPRSALPLPRPTGWVRPALLLAAGLGGRAPPIG